MSAPGNCTLSIAAPPAGLSGSAGSPSVLAGNLVRFLISFTDIAGVAADPTTVDVFVGLSYYDEATLTPVHDATGSYHADWDTTGLDAGTYYCVADGTGAIQASAELPVTIKAPHL